MSKILDNLYLGSYADAKNQTFLKRIGATHIVTVGVELQTLYPQHYKYLYIAAHDNPAFKLNIYFDQIADFIHDAIENQKGTVFVHCMMGISRSTSSIIAYLVKHHRMHPAKARTFIKSKRSIIFPNEGFVRQLERYAKVLGVLEENFRLGSPKKLMNATTAGKFISEETKTSSALEEETKVNFMMTPGGVTTIGKTTKNVTFAPEEPGIFKHPMSVTKIGFSGENNRLFSASSGRGGIVSRGLAMSKGAQLASPVKSGPTESDYHCKNCAIKVFEVKDVLHSGSKGVSMLCSNIYLNFMPWMGYIRGGVGKLFCPNSKCGSIIGFCNQRGGKCPCGKAIHEMYAVYPQKVVMTKGKLALEKGM